MFEGKHLEKSRDQRLLAGVCGGIAERAGVRASVVRLTWFVLTLLTGIVLGVAAYIILALLVPTADQRGRAPPKGRPQAMHRT